MESERHRLESVESERFRLESVESERFRLESLESVRFRLLESVRKTCLRKYVTYSNYTVGIVQRAPAFN